jgi:AraC-like DNA-binding protein
MRSIVRRFGAETAQGTEIHWVPAGRVAPETLTGVPSVHAAWNGCYSLSIDGHTPLKLEDEVFVALNAGHVLSTRGRRDPASCLLSVYFAPDLLAAALEALAPDDPLWYEEQVSFLLPRLLGLEVALARTVDGLTHMKSWKRRETFVRLARVTDLIHSCYERALTIEELAGAAHWSRFHMMREFKAVHGISPYEYLQRRRTQVAARLLCSTDLSVAEIAERTGFHVRTLVRRLRRSRGLGARALRTLAHETTQSQQPASYRLATSVV